MEIEVAPSSQAEPVVDPAASLPAAYRQSREVVELPHYLVHSYGWAYLWPPAVWFFDHQPIINAILFGNYRKVMDATLRLMSPNEGRAGDTLLMGMAYGELAPTLARHVSNLHVIDAATIQLEAAGRKLEQAGLEAHLGLMQAEALTYNDDAFDVSLMFLLLHEMPAESRRRCLAEAVRVARPGGRVVVAEYGERGRRHPFHRFAPIRWILTRAEPYLDGFWRERLDDVVAASAMDVGKSVEPAERIDVFGGFYRVASYQVA